MNKKPKNIVRVTKTIRVLPETFKKLSKVQKEKSCSLGKAVDYLLL